MRAAKRNGAAGFALSLVATALWGVLPIALKELLVGMDAVTAVWYRFLAALAVLLLWSAFARRSPFGSGVSGSVRALLLLAALGLCGNYVSFAYSLNFVNAETSEAVIQLTTLFLILGGVVVYREPFGRMQRLGSALILAGLVLFFHDRLPTLFAPGSRQTTGVLMVVLSAVLWTAYALLQKRLLLDLSSPQILCAIYAVSFLALTPFASPAALLGLTGFQLALLAFCCANTLIAYGCFAEALNRWDASKVSATLALAPLFTIGTLELIVFINPAYPFSDRLPWVSLFGAGLLIAGSILAALMPALAERRA